MAYGFDSAGRPIPANAATRPGTITPASGSVKDWTVAPATQTVQGQFNGLIAQKSPLMEISKTNALKGMNQRGLLNSSMAIGAGEAAAYEAALPIATADANTYATAAKSNSAEYNQTARTNAQNDTSLATANIGAKASAASSAAAERLGYAKIAAEEKMAGVGHKYSMELQNSQMAGSIFANGQSQIASILQDSSMSTEAKQSAIDSITASTAEGLALFKSMGGIDLTGFLSF